MDVHTMVGETSRRRNMGSRSVWDDRAEAPRKIVLMHI